MTNSVKYIDLFCGMGGLRTGFEQALKELSLEGSCEFSSDIKESALKAYNFNFNENIEKIDITKVEADEIPDFDFLLAGFPCQAFSSAGNRLGFEDTRGTLFFDVARILKEKQPEGFILENVEGLVNHDKGKTFKVIENTLLELGYKVTSRIINGSDFGLAQSRNRIYIIGHKNNNINIDDYPKKTRVLGDILEQGVEVSKTEFTQKLLNHFKITELYGKSIKDKRGGSNNIHSWDIEIKGRVSEKQKNLLNQLLKERRKKEWAKEIGITWMDGMPLTLEQIKTFYFDKELYEMLEDLVEKGYLKFEHPKEKIGNKRVYDESKPKGYNIVTGKLSFEYSKILSPFEITPTLVAMDVNKLGVPSLDPLGIRRLTKREGLRLFGYPETYSLDDLSESQAFDLLGNTVCVPVITHISKKMLINSSFIDNI